jgi:putative thioredoxin
MTFADPTTTPDDLIKEGSDAAFIRDVVEASKAQPVIVDFWATWCGPCRQLTPALEKAVRAAKGAVKLVKIDVDKNPAYAGQLRVQSIPTVYAFVNGQPVDGFQGAIPDSQIAAFIDRLTGGAAAEAPGIEQLLSLGEESLSLGDFGGAAQAFAEILAVEPDNVKAIAGLARVYLAGGDVDQARQTLSMIPADSTDPSVQAVRAQLALADQTPASGATAELEARLKADPTDHQARFDLAGARAASGDLKGAVDDLLAIVAADRDWNDQAARKQLLTIFEAAGLSSEVARDGRRRLSSILFA